MSVRIPNLFIIGAPKCGTTALYSYLSTHPDIYFSQVKEPHWFCKDIPSRISRGLDTLDDYLSLFKTATSEIYIGEASVWYLYSDVALKLLYEFNPEARILVMVRSPLEMVQSLHAQMVMSSEETELNFESAWQAQNLRKSGKNIPRFCREKKLLQYKQACLLGSQVKHVFDIFPSNAIKVLFFDDLKDSPRELYLDVLKFLELEDDGRIEFKKINQRKSVRFPWLALLSQRTYFTKLVSIYNTIKKQIGLENTKIGIYSGIKATLRKLNTYDNKNKNISEQLCNELIHEFKDDIELLGNLTGRDLSSWLDHSRTITFKP